MDDLKKAVNSIINERLNSPIIGAFMLSWMVFNWKVIVFLIFETQKKFEGDKIQYILDNYLADPWSYLYWPLIFAALYPIISLITFTFTEVIDLAKNEVNFFIQKKKSIDANQKMDLLKQISDQKSNYVDQLNEKDEEIKELNETLTEQMGDSSAQYKILEEKNGELKKENENQRGEIEKLEKVKENFRRDLKLTIDKDSEVKKENKNLRLTESELRNKIEELELSRNRIQMKDSTDNSDLEQYVDAFLDDDGSMEFLNELIETPKGSYEYLSAPSDLAESLFRKLKLIETSPLDVDKVRMTDRGRNFYEMIKANENKSVK